MIITTRANTPPDALDKLVLRVEGAGARAHIFRNGERAHIACVGGTAAIDMSAITNDPCVDVILHSSRPHILSSREFRDRATVIALGDRSRTRIGASEVVVMAGPCSVEGRNMILESANAVQRCGARVLRGGAFKPRSSPYAFQGMGEAGLQLLAEARTLTGMPVITEVMDTRQVELVARYADVLQIGARNMQNFALLKEVGRVRRPVMLKRGLSATIAELLMAAEYIVAQGNGDVILCERGIRTYETATRNTLDVAAIPVLKRETHLPVFVDPSHAGGKAHLVMPLSLAAIAAGADGLIVEVHPDPATALSDGEQSLTPFAFRELMTALKPVTRAVGRTLCEELTSPPADIQSARCAA